MLEWFFGDFSAWQIAVLAIGALIIGINKTALPGIGLLPVILLASTFETRLSTGLQLGMLALADIMAVIWYHRHADWKILLRLLPWALAGLAVGSAILRFIPPDDTRTMNIIIGVIVIALAIFSVIRKRLNPDKIPSGTGAAACYGILLGTTSHHLFLKTISMNSKSAKLLPRRCGTQSKK